MSQSINLGNVFDVNFNGATVDKINLNGSQVWKKPFTMVSGYRQGTDFCVPIDQWGWWNPAYASGGWEQGTVEIGSISSVYPDDVGGGTRLTAIRWNSLGSLEIVFEGENAVKRFNSVTINGYTFVHHSLVNRTSSLGWTSPWQGSTRYAWQLWNMNGDTTHNYTAFPLRQTSKTIIGNALFPLGQTIEVSFT